MDPIPLDLRFLSEAISTLNKQLKVKLAAAMYSHDENSEEGGEICLVGQDLTELSLNEYGTGIRKIDLSFNALVNLRGLHTCASSLEELILDNNLLEKVEFRADFPKLHTLSLNKNRITDLDALIQELSSRVKNLRHLSLHGNPVCPDQLLNDLAEEKDYQLYRSHILHHLRNIRFLDHRSVSPSELKESRRWIYAKVKIIPAYTPLSSSASNVLYPYSPLSSSSSSPVPDQLSIVKRMDNERVSRTHTANVLHESNIEATLSSMANSNGNGHQPNQDNNAQNMNPSSSQQQYHSRGRTGKRRFRYVGKNSEGNRFIQDEDL